MAQGWRKSFLFWKNHRPGNPGAATASSRYRLVIALQVVLLLLVLAGGSLHIYDYTEHDPTFCVNCHLMKEAHQKWQTSVHKGVECHACHYATVYQRNKMLIKAFLERPLKVAPRPHDKIIVPGTMCIKCHWDGPAGIPKISRSTGHAMHWFKGGIDCTSCHARRLHQFAPEQNLCVNCHALGKVVLKKMADMKCTGCHDFRGGDLRPRAEKCVQCHQDRYVPPPAPGASLAHVQFDCMTCHHTHDPSRPPQSACQTCHFLTMRRGKHPVHLKTLGGDGCTACHTPHRWRITEADAGKLCAQCHKPQPLRKFG